MKYMVYGKNRNAEETIDQASEEIIEDLEKILQDNASVEEVADETPVVAEEVTDETPTEI